jgi:hypothetical protein
VARLTAQEESLLKKLMSKREAPDAPQSQRTLNISIDLGDEKQVERATRLGLLDMFDDDEPDSDEPEPDGDEPEPDDTPKRRGYF